MMIVKNILVATDFGETSEVALSYGRAMARAFGARLHVLHMVEDVTLRYSSEIGLATLDLQKDLEKAAWRGLEEILTADDRKTLNAKPMVQSCFSVAAGITDYARENAIDLIITGTHGRGVVKHLLMGSVAERVVRTAPCPVLTVRPQERDFVVADVAVETASATGPRPPRSSRTPSSLTV